MNIEHLTQVVTERGDESGILPAGTISGAAKAIDATVRLTLHEDITLELLQGAETNLKRMLIEAPRLGVVMFGTGWQVADHGAKPYQEPLGECSRLGVK